MNSQKFGTNKFGTNKFGTNKFDKKYNNKKKPFNLNKPKNNKYMVNENGFEDIEVMIEQFDSDCLIKKAFGSLTSDSLTKDDVGKHVAIFVDFEHMNKFFHDKKFDNGNDKNAINNFNTAFKQSLESYSNLIPKGAFITGEIMNQNRVYTKSNGQMSIVLHGSIVASVPQEMITFDNLEALCDAYKMEGFVVVCKETSSRFKLKQCCFPTNEGLGKKMHNTPLTKDDFTEEGLILCNNGDFGYHVAALANVSAKQTIASKCINGFDTSLIVLPNEDTIQNQLENKFDGDKMINFFATIGEGNTYRYIPQCNFSGSTNNLIFQKKFDGESILLHVDDNGKFHMLVRFNLDVFEVLGADKSIKFRFGWVKK